MVQKILVQRGVVVWAAEFDTFRPRKQASVNG